MGAVARATVVVVLLSGCAVVDTAEPADPTPSPALSAPALPVPSVDPDGGSLTGAFGGDAGLEGGCAWLDTAGGRYEVLYPEGYEVRFDPLRLEGPDGTVAGAGDTITVEGRPAAGMASICQVGELFRATAVSPS